MLHFLCLLRPQSCYNDSCCHKWSCPADSVPTTWGVGVFHWRCFSPNRDVLRFPDELQHVRECSSDNMFHIFVPGGHSQLHSTHTRTLVCAAIPTRTLHWLPLIVFSRAKTLSLAMTNSCLTLTSSSILSLTLIRSSEMMFYLIRTGL